MSVVVDTISSAKVATSNPVTSRSVYAAKKTKSTNSAAFRANRANKSRSSFASEFLAPEKATLVTFSR